MAEELNTVDAAAAIAALIGGSPEPEPEKKPESTETEIEASAEAEAETHAEETNTEETAEPTFKVKVDGKEIEIPLSELTAGYQRQADYTRKTMEVAEQRKTAQAEASKAQQERVEYAQKLQGMELQLKAAISQHETTDWDALLKSDPVKYLQERHLAEQRQAALQSNLTEQRRLAEQFEAEARQARAEFVKQQSEHLIAKLPEWKDDAKAKAEKSALRDYLKAEGYQDDEVSNVVDARAVVMARKAMLYDQMIAKAQAAAKKVVTLPTKVEKPGAGEPQNIDRREAAYKRLSKSGRVEDAADVFASIL